MRVFIITQDEPIYAPLYLANIIERSRQSIVGITTLSPTGNKGWIRFIQQRWSMYGPLDFAKAGCLYLYCRIRAMVPTSARTERFYSVAKLAACHSIPLCPSSDVNNRTYIETLKALNPDIVLSVAANQRFEGDLLKVPRLDCLNIHSALLPDYRGIDGLFWALAHGETQVGVTVHMMSENFDEGPIVGQEPFRISPEDTLHTAYLKAIEVGSDLIARVLEELSNGTVTTRPNDVKAGSYFSWPDRQGARLFRQRGRRFF